MTWLLSVEQLVAASRGRAPRGNQPEGGAVFAVELSLSSAARA